MLEQRRIFLFMDQSFKIPAPGELFKAGFENLFILTRTGLKEEEIAIVYYR